MRDRNLTPQLRDRILSALREGLRRPDAARRARVSPRHILRWLMRGFREKQGTYAEFHRAFYWAVREGRLAAVRAIIRAVDDGDWRTALDWLDRSFPPVSTEESTIDDIAQVLREAEAASASGPSPERVWQRTWERLARELLSRTLPRFAGLPEARHDGEPVLDEYDTDALRRLLAAAGRLRGGPYA